MEYPLGVRRDGSYYTRIEWANMTESDPTFWVNNLIDDDTEREGGTWGANTMGLAICVLSFFGETQEVSRMRIFRNVGLPISILEELAKTIDVYYSDTDEPRKIRRKEHDIDSVEWKFVTRITTEKAEGWQDVEFPEPIKAKYIRIDLVENHGTPPEIPWTELSEVKFYK